MLVEKGTPGHWARSAPRPGDARGSLHKESWATSEAVSLWLVDEETPGPSRGLAGVSYLDGPWSPWKRLQEAQLLEVGALFHPKQVWVTLRVRVGVKEGEGKGGEYFSTWGCSGAEESDCSPVGSLGAEVQGGRRKVSAYLTRGLPSVLCYSGFCISRPSNTPQAAPVTGSSRSCLGVSLHRQGLFCMAPARCEGHLRIFFWRPSQPRSSGSEPEAW